MIKKHILFLIFMLVLVSLFTSAAADENNSPRVTALRGSVSVYKAGGLRPSAMFIGMEIGDGDVIVTDVRSSVTIAYYHKEVVISELTKLSINSIWNRHGRDNSSLVLVEGMVKNRIDVVLDNSSRNEIRAANTIAGVRGTEYILIYSRMGRVNGDDNPFTRLMVLDGEVRFDLVGQDLDEIRSFLVTRYGATQITSDITGIITAINESGEIPENFAVTLADLDLVILEQLRNDARAREENPELFRYIDEIIAQKISEGNAFVSQQISQPIFGSEADTLIPTLPTPIAGGGATTMPQPPPIPQVTSAQEPSASQSSPSQTQEPSQSDSTQVAESSPMTEPEATSAPTPTAVPAETQAPTPAETTAPVHTPTQVPTTAPTSIPTTAVTQAPTSIPADSNTPTSIPSAPTPGQSSGSTNTPTPIPANTPQDQAQFSIDPIGTKTFGNMPFILSTSGGSGSGAVTFALVNGNAVSVAENTGMVTIERAGTAVVTATKAGSSVFNPTSATITIQVGARNINNAAVNITSSHIYDGTEHTPTFTVIDGVNNLITADDYTISYSGSRINAGTPILTLAGTGNYTGVKEIPFTIARRGLSIGFAVDDKVYDGNVLATITSRNIGSGLITADAGRVIVTDGSAMFEDKNAGVGKTVMGSNFSLSGERAGNYTIATIDSATATIKPKPIVITGVTAVDRAYDGTVNINLGNGSLQDVIAGDHISFTLNGGTVSNPNAGINKLVDVNLIPLTGNDAGNYSLDDIDDDIFVDISKVSLTVTAHNQSVIFRNPAPTNLADFNGFIPGESDGTISISEGLISGSDGLISGTLSFSSIYRHIDPNPSNVGFLPIVPIVSGLSATNYDFSPQNGVLAITPKSLAGAVINVINSLAFNGAAQTPAYTVHVDNILLVEGLDYLVQYTNNINSGIDTAVITITGRANYSETATQNFSIDKGTQAPLNIADPGPKEYGMYVFGLAEFVSGGSGTGALSYESSNNNILSVATDTGMVSIENAGTARITVTKAGDSNFSEASSYIDITVGKRNLSHVTITEITGLVYSGLPHEPLPTVTDGSKNLSTPDDYTVSHEGDIINANLDINTTTARVVLTATNSGNYFGTAEAAFTIAKAPLTITADSFTIGFGEQPPAFTSSFSAFVNNETESVLTGTLGHYSSYIAGDPQGTYPIIPYGLESGNYHIDYVDGVLTVGTAGQQALVVSEPTLTFGDQPTTLVVTGGSGDGVVTFESSDASVFSIDSDGLITIHRVGTSTVTVNKAASSDGNFTATSATRTITVNTRDLANVTVEPIGDETYTGNELKPIGLVLTDYVGGVNILTASDYSDDYDYENNTNAGSNARVIIHATTDGNYHGFREVSFVINKAELSVIADDQEVTFGDNPPNFTVRYEHLLGYYPILSAFTGEPIVTSLYTNNSDIGTYEIVVNCDNMLASNFFFTPVNGELTVVERNVSEVSVSVDGTFTYTGQPHTPSPTVMLNGLVFPATNYNVTHSNNVNAGEATVTITGTGNFTGSVSGTFTINPAPLTVNFTVGDKIYDGDTEAVITSNSLVGVLPADVGYVTLNGGEAEFEDRHVGINKIVEATGFTLSGVRAGNYFISEVTPTTANISRRTITITGVNATSRPYNGLLTVELTNGTLQGVITGDVVTFSLGSGTMNDASIGNGKAVSVMVSLSGADAGNYTLTQPDGITVDIVPVPLTVSIVAPTNALTPLAGEYSGDFTVTVSGLIGSDTITLNFASSSNGLTLSNNTVGSSGTITLTYDRTTPITTIDPIDIEMTYNIGSSYEINTAPVVSVRIIDGQSVNRRIPINQNNIMAFNDYARSTAGLTRHYGLMTDVTLASDTEWIGIGAANAYFTGSFDGCGLIINNLTVSGAGTQGMFRLIGTGGVVRNLGLENVNISSTGPSILPGAGGGSNAGAIAGRSSGTIENCYVTGNVSGTNNYVGGIVGNQLQGGTIRNCYAIAQVSGTSRVGGIVGWNGSMVIHCYATGAITGTTHVGGIVGESVPNTSNVQRCVAINQSVMATLNNTNTGRVAGRGVGSTLNNNFALSNMVTSLDNPQSSRNGVNGLSVTADQLISRNDVWDNGQNANFYTNGSPWAWQDGKMPFLFFESGGRDWPNFISNNNISTDDPILVHNEADLLRVGSGETYDGRVWSLSAHYKLMNNITMSSNWDNWTRIGGDSEISGFSGTFDGNGYTVSGLSIISTSMTHQGMFGFIGTDGEVKNLNLANVTIHCNGEAGGIAGENRGLIENCIVSGSINNQDENSINNGGIVGSNAGSIIGCLADFQFFTSSSQVAGISGSNSESGKILFCTASGEINGGSGSNIGGVVGVNHGLVQDCMSNQSSLGGGGSRGGIAGRNHVNGTVERCYTKAESFGSGSNIGGIVGLNSGSVDRCVALNPALSAGESFGRITGNIDQGFVTNVFACEDMSVWGTTGHDGVDVSAVEFNNQSWWNITVGFNFGTGAWQWNSQNSLPYIDMSGA